MYVLKVEKVGFFKNGDHTVRYNEALAQITEPWVKGVKEGTFKWVIADTFEAALSKLQSQIKEHVSCFNWAKVDINDIWFTERHEEVKDGQFWTPCATTCHKYRLSDLGYKVGGR